MQLNVKSNELQVRITNWKLPALIINCHALPRLDSEQAEKDRTDAIGKVEEKVNVYAPFMGAKGKAMIDKEFEKYVSETDPKVWSRRAKLSRDDAWYDFKGMTREEAERKQRDLEAKRAEEKRKFEDIRNMKEAISRAKEKGSKKAQAFFEYENELRNKYRDESRHGPEKYHYWTRATNEEMQKLRDLEAALVMRDKNGKWRVAKSEDEFWDDEEFIIEIDSRVNKSSPFDLIEDVFKFNEWHDPKTGRFTNKLGGVGNSTRSYGQTDLKDAVEENEKASASGSKFRNSLHGHVDKNGRLTPEREAVHKKIIDDILAGKEPVKGQATMTMLGGGPASGKSSVMSADTSNDKHAITVDPDYIKTKLPGYKELSKKSSDAANIFHEESSALAKRLASVAYNENFNVIYDGTGDGSNNSVRKEIKAARERGYAVNAVYVSVDTETAVARNKKRYEDAVAKGENPRLVPEDTVRNIHRNCTDISVSMAPEFDHIEIWDNNGARGQQKLIAEGGSGKGLVAKDKEKFDNYLSKGNRGKDGFTTLPDGQVIPVCD